MAQPVSILLYGRDPHLLESRKWVLETPGYQVTTAMGLSEVDRGLSGGRIDLMVLCYSLSVEDTARAIALVRAKLLPTKCLLMIANEFRPAFEGADEIISTKDGPAKLLATVGKIVARKSGAGPSVFQLH